MNATHTEDPTPSSRGRGNSFAEMLTPQPTGSLIPQHTGPFELAGARSRSNTVEGGRGDGSRSGSRDVGDSTVGSPRSQATGGPSQDAIRARSPTSESFDESEDISDNSAISDPLELRPIVEQGSQPAGMPRQQQTISEAYTASPEGRADPAANSGWSTQRGAPQMGLPQLPQGLPEGTRQYVGANRQFNIRVTEVIQACIRGSSSAMEKYSIAGEVGVTLEPSEGPLMEDFQARLALSLPADKIQDLTLNHGVGLLEPRKPSRPETPPSRDTAIWPMTHL